MLGALLLVFLCQEGVARIDDDDQTFASKTLGFVLVEGVVKESKELGGRDGILDIEIEKVGLGSTALVGKTVAALYECRFKEGSRFRDDVWSTQAAVPEGKTVVAAIRASTREGPVITHCWGGNAYAALENGQKLLSQLEAVNAATTNAEFSEAAFIAVKTRNAEGAFVWGRICHCRSIWSDDFAKRISESIEHDGKWRRSARVSLNSRRPEWGASEERRADLVEAVREATDVRQLHHELDAFINAMAVLEIDVIRMWSEDLCSLVLEIENRPKDQRQTAIFLINVRLEHWPSSVKGSRLVFLDAVFRMCAAARNYEFRQRLEDALLQIAEEGPIEVKENIVGRLSQIDDEAFRDLLKAAAFSKSMETGQALKLPVELPPLESPVELVRTLDAGEAAAIRRGIVVGEFVIARELDSNLVETHVKINEVIRGPVDWKGKRTAPSIHAKPREKGIRRWQGYLGRLPSPDWFDFYIHDHDVRCWEIDPASGRATRYMPLRSAEYLRAISRFPVEFEQLEQKSIPADELRAKEQEWLQLILNQEELFWRRTESEADYQSQVHRGAILHPLPNLAMHLLARAKRTVDTEYFQRASRNDRYGVLLRTAFAGHGILEQPSFAKSDTVRGLLRDLSEKGRSVDEAVALIYLVRRIADAQQPDGKLPFDLKAVLTDALDPSVHSKEYRLAIAHTLPCIAGAEAAALRLEMMLDQVANEPPLQLDAAKLPAKDTVSDAFFCELRMFPFFKDRAEFESLTERLRPEVKAVLEKDHAWRFEEMERARSLNEPSAGP